MDAGPRPRKPGTLARPPGWDRVALALQGGGALGAYQAGVYEALHEAGLEPDRVAGVSIGAINAALIAGNPPARRLERLRAFWETVTSRPVPFPGAPFLNGTAPDGDDARRAFNAWSSLLTLGLGQPAFFTPRPVNPWLAPRGAKGATSFYDSAPLRETLLRLVDFRLINSREVGFAVGAVNVGTGNFAYFDNAEMPIGPEHVMASGALPPALPAVQVGTDLYWDGGLVSNTPLAHLLDTAGSDNTLIFQVDLFSARGAVPRDMMDVLGRMKDIQYSSRTRMVTSVATRHHERDRLIRSLLERLPASALTPAERALRDELARLPAIAILELIYQQVAYEGQAKDYDFSAASMHEHWKAGLRDTRATLARRDWLSVPEAGGIVTYDIHRLEDG